MARRVIRKEKVYPKAYKSELRDTGSRTIDPGEWFRIEIDDDQFCATRFSGQWSTDDLFGDMSYWPDKLLWSGSSETLGDLISKIASAIPVPESELLAVLAERLDDREIWYWESPLEFDVSAFLEVEKRVDKKGLIQALVSSWPGVSGECRIPGIPSPKEEEGSFYNGLDLRFEKGVWSGELFGGYPECCYPDTHTAESFEYMCKPDSFDLPWTVSELRDILIQHDAAWRTYVDPAFSFYD